MKKVIGASRAVALAAKICKPKVIAAYPITPQTLIVENLAEMVNNGEMQTELIEVESEHSAMSACIGAQATGVRTFTSTSSQGLALMHEMLFIASGLRLPIIMAVANRALSAPINIWCFSKDAKVLMKDLSYKHIDKIKEGDEVIGKDKKGNLRFTKIKKIFKRATDELVKLKTNEFELVCTPEHKFYYYPGHSHWSKAKNLKNKKLHWFGCSFEENKEFTRGWLAGMSDGDGCFFRNKLNQYRFTLKVKDEEIIDTFVRWSNEHGFNLRKADYHKKRGYYTTILTRNKETKRFQKFFKKARNMDFCRGYLAGIYDAEGSGPYKVKQAVIYNNNKLIVDFISKSLKYLKISFKIYIDDRRGKYYKRNNYHIKINNVPEFFIKCRPVLERKRNNLLRMTLKSIKSRLEILDVINIKKKMIVYNLETGTNNYIVNGLLVHNCDHQDTIAERDSGWIQFYVDSGQEALDTILMAYKIAENKNILLPAMVCLDGFTLTHVFEPVDIPEQKEVDTFLPEYRPLFKLDPKKPITIGPVAYPNSYMEIKHVQNEAMYAALEEIKKVHAEFSKKFKRAYGNGLIQMYKMEDAEYALIGMGTLCSTAREVIDALRKEGKKVGLIKIKTYRPFPAEDIIKYTDKLKAAAVIDRDISLGQEGALYADIKAALQGKSNLIVNSFIAGLGGRDIKIEHIRQAFDKTILSKKELKEWLF